MKIQQLRFLAAVAQNDLNITAASAKVHATQPALSKQLKLLEDELGFNIFVRRGRTLEKVTPAGERVINHALKILREVQNIKGVSTEFKGEERGSLSIGTTHTQARYVLPPGDTEVPCKVSGRAVPPSRGNLRADRADGAVRSHRSGDRDWLA